ncbi:MAG: hypothetical protein KDJ16_14325 [Hyphomicrobiales bacterium]|nr:hypothetical protein [Hyphomicrobiales bacterium]
MAKMHMMEADEFKRFFDELAGVAMSAREGAGKGDSVAEILKKNGIEMDLPEPVRAQVGPLLDTPPHKMREVPHNCKPCAACGVCMLCGLTNAAASGAFSAGVWVILD